MNYDTVLPDRIRTGFKHKPGRKPFNLIKLTAVVLLASCALPFSIHQWQLVQAQAHKREIQMQLEHDMAHHNAYGPLLQYLKTL